MSNADLIALIGPIARHFFGPPNPRLSTATELRFGTHGSLAVDLIKGVWFDHENNIGGNLIDMIMRQQKFTEARECFQWMETEGWTASKGNGGSQPHGARREVAHYDYTDEAGNFLSQVVRFEPKQFLQRVRDPSSPDGWTYSTKGVRRVLYRLPQLLEALATEKRILIVEGEKDVDNCWKRNIPATTNIGGAGKWREIYNPTFNDGDIIIVADNDDAGRTHAATIANNLKPVAARVRVLDLAQHWHQCPDKGDISDLFNAGFAVEDLNHIIDGLPDWTPVEGVNAARQRHDNAKKFNRGAPGATLAQVHAKFKHWLGKDYDLDTLDAMLAVVASERLSGDPPWLLIISGPGNAKTETVQATSGIGAIVVSTLTSDAALLSGMPKKSRSRNATGGLLRQTGERGILAIKDVTSILSMNRDLRTTVIAALREIHDGRWVRNIGSDGGLTLEWTGRIVIIGACTTAWDTAHSVVATMGDRFVIVRSNSKEGRIESGLQAIRNTGREAQMREELADAVSSLIATIDPSNPYKVTKPNENIIVHAANLVTLARTGVEIDYRGDVVDAHAPESRPGSPSN
jgi:hypothetical protein